MNTKHVRNSSIIFSCILGLAFFVGVGCGGGGSSQSTPVDINGSLVTRSGSAIAGASVAVEDPAGLTPDVTDPSGQFLFQLSGAVSSVTFAISGAGIPTQNYTISNIPSSTTGIAVRFMYSSSTQQISVTSQKFTDANGNDATNSPTPTPVSTVAQAPTNTPSGSATQVPTATATMMTSSPTNTPVAVSPTNTPTAAPTSASNGSFDANGNTTKFGIPAGLVGTKNRGASVWNNSCSGCHGNKDNRSYSQIINSYSIPSMLGLNLSNAQTADVVAYLNRNN